MVMNVRYYGLSDSWVYFFSDIAKDFESGKLREIPIMVKAAFVDDWELGIGLQMSQYAPYLNDLSGEDLEDYLLSDLLVRFNGKKYIVGVESKVTDQPVISVFDAANYQYLTDAQLSWDSILVGYMKKFWSKTRASMTYSDDSEVIRYLDMRASQIDWNSPPKPFIVK